MSQPELSELQVVANQLNALKSTGPRTEAGKNVARFNARRHGLTGQFYCMSEDDEKAYKSFETGLLETLKPEGAYETQVAICITQDQWRINRSRATEHNIFGQGHHDHAEEIFTESPNLQVAVSGVLTWKEDVRAFANIALYETRIHRMIAANEKRLQQLQAERKAAAADLLAAEAVAQQEAELLLRLAVFEGEVLTGSIDVDGFVFFVPTLLARLKRQDQLARAKSHAANNWRTAPPHSKAA